MVSLGHLDVDCDGRVLGRRLHLALLVGVADVAVLGGEGALDFGRDRRLVAHDEHGIESVEEAARSDVGERGVPQPEKGERVKRCGPFADACHTAEMVGEGGRWQARAGVAVTAAGCERGQRADVGRLDFEVEPPQAVALDPKGQLAPVGEHELSLRG